jgi:hypothetical protein
VLALSCSFLGLKFRAFCICAQKHASISIYCQDRTGRTGQPEQESQNVTGRYRIGRNMTGRQDRQKRTGRTGQAGQDRQNRTGRSGQAEQDRQNRTGKTGQAEQDRQNRTDRQNKTDNIGQTDQGRQNRTDQELQDRQAKWTGRIRTG